MDALSVSTSPVPAAHGAGRSRMAAGFGLLFLLAGAAFGALSWMLVRDALLDRAEVRLRERADRIEDPVEVWGRGVDVALERVERRLLNGAPGPMERLRSGGPRAAGVAAELSVPEALDVFTILDAQGRVVSSASWPQRAGLPVPELYRLPEGRPAVSPLPRPLGPTRGGVLLRRPLGPPADGLWMIGGIAADERLLDGWISRLTLYAGGEVVETVPAAGPVAADRSALATTREFLDSEGRVRAAAVVALDRTDDLRLLRRLAWILSGCALASGVLGLGAGAWAAGRARRPVRRLMHAVAAIGAGRADYAFTAGERDESDDLAHAFTRMQRSVERQQDRAVAAERVAAWSEIARHVAHEVKNPLAPIRLTVENLVRARARDPRLFDELFEEGSRTILEEVDQLRRLVGEFSDFARLPAPARRRVDLVELISGVLDLWGAEPGLTIDRRFESGPLVLELDPDQIRRVLQNVVGNAVEATADTSRGERRIEVRLAVEDDVALIEVEDNGPGLAPGAQERIFEPYFTTKGSGTGLGMAIAYRIVVEHGGSIAAENRAPAGASLRIRLPLSIGESD